MSLIDYQARFNDPCIMEFQQPDTVGMGNRYFYVNNNPINFNDPNGHDTCDEEGNCYDRNGHKYQTSRHTANLSLSVSQSTSMEYLPVPTPSAQSTPSPLPLSSASSSSSSESVSTQPTNVSWNNPPPNTPTPSICATPSGNNLPSCQAYVNWPELFPSIMRVDPI
jgi:hypothetical protein